MRKLFNQKFVQSVVSGPDAQFIVADKLEPDAAKIECVSTPGAPCAADGLVYNSTQRLLAVSTHAGYVKVIGGPGVDTELRTSSASQTLSLENIAFAGAMLRLSEAGEVELLQLENKKSSSALRSDEIFTCASAFPVAPYVALGCLSGALRIASLQGPPGRGLWVPGVPAEGLKLTSYGVPPDKLLGMAPGAPVPTFGTAGVAAVAVHGAADQFMAVLAFMNNVIAVWNFRAEELIALATAASVPVLEAAGPATTVTWLASAWAAPAGFATGHKMGHILVWGLPKGTTGAPQLLMKLRGVTEDRPATPIQGLISVPAPTLAQHRLLAFGGQAVDEPQLLTLFNVGTALASAAEADTQQDSTPLTACDSQSLHWFGTIEGFALVGSRTDPLCLTQPQGVVVLTEGGQLMMHDLQELQPHPVELPYSCLSRVTAACWATTREPSRAMSCSLTLQTLYSLRKQLAAVPGAQLTADVLAGGQPAELDANSAQQVYVTGHNDGSVRLWLFATEAPLLCAEVEPVAGTRQAAVTVVQLCSASGMLAVGRKGGLTDLYQLHEHARTVLLHNFDVSAARQGPQGPSEGPTSTVEPLQQGPGFQLVLRVRMPATVSALELASRHRLLVIGDESGSLLAVDVAQPLPLLAMQTGLGALGQLSLVYSVLAATDRTGAARRASMDTRRIPGSNMPKLVLVVAAQDSTLLAIDMERREVLGKPLKPKTASSNFRCLSALDLEALNTSTIDKAVELPWANPAEGPGPLEGPQGPLEEGVEESVEGSVQGSRAASKWPSMDGQTDNAEQPMAPGSPRAQEGPRQGAFEGDDDEGPRPGSAFADAVAQQKASNAAESVVASPRSDTGSVGAASAGGVRSGPGSRQASATFASFSSQQNANPFAAAEAPASVSSLAAPSEADAAGHIVGNTSTTSQTAETVHITESGSGRLSDTASQDAAGEGSQGAPSGAPGLRMAMSERAPGKKGSLKEGWKDKLAAAQSAMLPESGSGFGMQRGEGRTNSLGNDHLSPYASANFAELEGSDHPTIVAYVLSVTQQYARLYHFDHVRSGDRTAMHKVTFEEPVAAAGTFVSKSGPGLACVTYTGNIMIYALPNLTQLQLCSIDAVTGAKWGSSNDKSWLHSLDSARVSQDGQLLVFGPFGHMARLTLVKGAPVPLPCGRLVDWDIEKAVHTTCELQSHTVAQSSGAGSAGGSVHAGQEASTQRPGTPPEAAMASSAAGAGGKKMETAPSGKRGGLAALKTGGFGGFLSNVVHKVVDAGTEVADSLQGKLGKLDLHRRELPTLEAVFAKTVVLPPAPGRASSMTAVDPSPHPVQGAPQSSSAPAASTSAAADRASLLGTSAGAPRPPTGPPEGDPGAPSSSAPSSSGIDRERIAQAGRAVGPDGKPRARTIEEIRAAYGIKQKKADTLQGVMSENAELLAQRGEKLKQLDERTQQMEDEAKDFAAVAKKLAEGENKKWWQL